MTLNDNQLYALCAVKNWGRSNGSASRTVSSLLQRGLIERTGRSTYRITAAGAEIVRQIRAAFGE